MSSSTSLERNYSCCTGIWLLIIVLNLLSNIHKPKLLYNVPSQPRFRQYNGVYSPLVTVSPPRASVTIMVSGFPLLPLTTSHFPMLSTPAVLFLLSEPYIQSLSKCNDRVILIFNTFLESCLFPTSLLVSPPAWVAVCV